MHVGAVELFGYHYSYPSVFLIFGPIQTIRKYLIHQVSTSKENVHTQARSINMNLVFLISEDGSDIEMHLSSRIPRCRFD